MGPQIIHSLVLIILYFSVYNSFCFCISGTASTTTGHGHHPGYESNSLAYPSYDTDQIIKPSIFNPNYGHELQADESFNFHGSDDHAQMVGTDPAINSASHNVRRINVDDFGAKADGTKDDSKAFKKAWKKACSSKEAVLVVPMNKTYLLKPVTFSGPCKSNITIMIDGDIEASSKRSDYKRDRRHWIVFKNVQNFTVEGNGTLNGNGEIWWKNSCKVDKSKPCTHAPTALTFNDCKNLMVKNNSIKDAQQMHLRFEKCVNVEAINLLITAPEDSPNTDGIHVTHSQNIKIVNSNISTGDDCISIVSGSQSVQAVNITCGPGHGISIGSLGEDQSEAHVSDVMVDTASLNGTTNGVRIKTWQGGSGSANNITFQNIAMHNVKNPIIIDQNYCDQDDPCKEQESAVQISDVLYKNITGTSASEVAVKFDCSKRHPCRHIVLQDINLVGEDGERAKAFCNNVDYTQVGKVLPGCSSKISDVLSGLLYFLIGY